MSGSSTLVEDVDGDGKPVETSNESKDESITK